MANSHTVAVYFPTNFMASSRRWFISVLPYACNAVIDMLNTSGYVLPIMTTTTPGFAALVYLSPGGTVKYKVNPDKLLVFY